MEIGFAGYNCAEPYRAHFRALRPSWVKVSVDAESGACDLRTRPDVAEPLALGVKVVVDFRCGCIQLLAERDQAHGGPPYSWFTDTLRATVELTGGAVRDWEIWGEWACPAVAQGIFGGRNYRDLLEAAYTAVKEADPDCRVWTGGFGVNFGLRAYQRLLEQGADEFFDVLNLHPFVHHRPWPEAEAAIHRGFGYLRELEIRTGAVAKPIACTEFGWPVTRAADGRALKSNVFEVVQALGENVCADWTERSLALLESYGVQALMWCTLVDAGPPGVHWGHYLGILRKDGTPKPNYPVVADWIDRGR